MRQPTRVHRGLLATLFMLSLAADAHLVRARASDAAASVPPSASTTLFTTGFESGDPRPTWTNTVDGGGYPAGGVARVAGVCCRLAGPETGVRIETAHAGAALMYSGKATGAHGSHAYDKVFDLSSKTIVVGPTTTLSYWIYPQSGHTAPVPVAGSNSACVAIDLVFAGGGNLRDSGAVDQNGVRLHPAAQCGHLTLDTWNHVTSVIGPRSPARPSPASTWATIRRPIGVVTAATSTTSASRPNNRLPFGPRQQARRRPRL